MATQNHKCTSSPGAEKHGLANWVALSDSQNASSPANRTNTIFKDKCRSVGKSSDVPQDSWINDSMHPPLPTPPRYRKWTIEEEEALCAGVDRHGIGSWQAILYDPLFASTLVDRSNVNLKDKWRTLNRSSDVSNKKRKVTACRDMYFSPEGSESDVYLIEELSNSQDHHVYLIEKVHGYLKKLWLSFPEDKNSSFTYINPLWYNLYLNDSNKEKVLSWIKKKDIFSRKYVFFPIFEWGHWSVLIFCHFGESFGFSELKVPCILLLDSLEKADHSKQLETTIRKFVLDIYEISEREDKRLVSKMPFMVPKVPQQRDQEESEFYALYYIKLFVESAPSYHVTPYFMKKDWANSEGLDSFRKALESSDV